MLSRRPEIAFGILALMVAVAVNVLDSNGTAQILSWVLTGATIRFVTLPGPRAEPNRRSGALLAVPFVVGLLFLFVGEAAGGKSQTGPMSASGLMLLSSWVILTVWESHRNRRNAADTEPSHG